MEAATATVPGVQHYTNVSNLQPDQFGERLDTRAKVCAQIVDVIATAATNGEIEQWEYPEIERSLGVTFAALFNVQLVPPTMGGDISTALLSSTRLPAGNRQ